VSVAAIQEPSKLTPTKQLEFPTQTLNSKAQWVNVKTLVDTGASACFVNKRWVNHQGMKTLPTTTPVRLALADGRTVGTLKETIELPVRHGAHTSTVMCYVTNIGGFDFILGMNWMDLHKPAIKFGFGHSMAFESPYCTTNCLHHGVPETVYDNGRPPRSSLKPEGNCDIHIISAIAAYKMTAHHPGEMIWIELHEWEKLEHKEPPDKHCDSETFWEKVAHCSTVGKEDFDEYMERMEQPPRTYEEL
jgi:hypothetical protein